MSEEKLVKVVTTQGVTISKPVLDNKGKIVTAKIKFNKREVDSEVHNIERHKADVVIEVSRSFAEELLAAKLVRLVDPALDDVVDPTKGTDPLA